MIEIEDFETIDDFKNFIIKYLNENHLFDIFESDIRMYSFYFNLDYYIDSFYHDKIKLNNFFIFPYCSFIGSTKYYYWNHINKQFFNYLETHIKENNCWCD